MSEKHDVQGHVDPIKDYIGVWFALLVLLGVTVWAAMFDFGALSMPIAMFIAIVKAAMVILIFMGMRHSTRLTQIWAIISLIFLFTMFLLFLGDYFSNKVSSSGEPGRLAGPQGWEPTHSTERQ